MKPNEVRDKIFMHGIADVLFPDDFSMHFILKNGETIIITTDGLIVEEIETTIAQSPLLFLKGDTS